MYILSSAFSSVIFSPATSFLCKQPILHHHLIHSTVSLWCHRLSAWNNIWKLHLKSIFLKLQHRLLHCLVWNHSTQRYYIINWLFVLLLSPSPACFLSNSASPRPPPPPPPTLSVSDGAAIHGSEGPCQRAVDCGARSGGQKRSQHQVRDHYFLTYTRLVQSCVCVPFRGCPVPGPRPGVGHERRTPPRHLTGWKNKNKKITLKKPPSRPAPDSRACPLHDDVWRCVVSLFFLLVSSSLFYFCSPPSLWPGPHSPACRAGAWPLNPVLWCTSVSTCRGNGQLCFSTSCLSVSQQSTTRLFCFQFLVFLFLFLPVYGCNHLASSLSSFSPPTASIPHFTIHFSPFVQLPLITWTRFETRALLRGETVF